MRRTATHRLRLLAITATLSVFPLVASTALAADVVVSANTTWSSNQSIDRLTIRRGATLTLAGNAKVTAANLTMDRSSNIQFATAGAELTVNGTAGLNSSARIYGNVVTIRGGTWTLGSSAHIDGNISMSVVALSTSSSAYLSADGYGEAADNGAGRGYRNDTNLTSGSGASHGGRGNPGYLTDSTRGIYGSALRPQTKGSGGGSSCGAVAGAGGGTIRLEVSGTLTLEGYIRANGAGGARSSCHSYRGAGGGAGGSIWVTTNRLAGSNGRFYASGGAGGGSRTAYRGGGGGGGRVAVYYFNGGLRYPQNSDVAGGYGLGGYAAKGTLAMIHEMGTPGDPADDTLYVYKNFRFEDGDGPFQFGVLNAYSATM